MTSVLRLATRTTPRHDWIARLGAVGLRLGLLACMSSAAIFSSAGSTAEERATAPSPPPSNAGSALYNYYCYQCHGYNGDARTLASSFLDPTPRNFRQTSDSDLTREAMIDAVVQGRPGTAMASFSRVLTADQVETVIDYIRTNFMAERRTDIRYHSEANGWPDHERYAAAFPFVTGKLLLDTPAERLDANQRAGKALYLTTCISCHDNPAAKDAGTVWDARAVSYPRRHYSHKFRADALSGASVYARHARPVPSAGLNATALRGRQVYLDNCAFCHAPDGSGRNWIGRFLEPSPRDFTRPGIVDSMTAGHLRDVINQGLPETSMPAWSSVLTDHQLEELIAFLKQAFGSDQRAELAVSEMRRPLSVDVPRWRRGTTQH